MSTTSASRAETAQDADRRILVWDLPVRIFHWLMALSFAGAYLTAESERWRLVHVTLGYTVAGLVAFRLLWGLAGSRHARFASFVRGPKAAARYLGSLLNGRPEHHVGHNPAGALAIVALLGLALTVTLAGLATYNDIGGEWLEELHEGAANAMLALVGVHIAAVVLSSRLHGESLVRAMIDGHKRGEPGDGIRNARSLAGIALLATVLGFWWVQWYDAPVTGPGVRSEAAKDDSRHHDDD